MKTIFINVFVIGKNISYNNPNESAYIFLKLFGGATWIYIY